MHRPQLLQALQKRTKYIKAASQMLEVAFKARGGGLLSTSLATIVGIGAAMDTLYPTESPWEWLESNDYRLMETPIGGYLCDLLLASNEPKQIIQEGPYSTLVVWPTLQVAAMYGGSAFSEGPYLKGDGTLHALHAYLRKAVWAEGQDLILNARHETNRSTKGSGRYRTSAQHAPGPYIRKIGPEWYANRILASDPNLPRTMALIGPTGGGKSVLARHPYQTQRQNAQDLQ